MSSFLPATPTTTILPEPLVLMAVFWFPASTSSPGVCPFHHPRWLQALLVFPTELSSFSFLQSVKCKCLKNATATFRKRFISEMILKVTADYRNIFCSEGRKLPIQFPLDSNFKKMLAVQSVSLKPTKQMLRGKNNKCSYKFIWWVLLRAHSF